MTMTSDQQAIMADRATILRMTAAMNYPQDLWARTAKRASDDEKKAMACVCKRLYSQGTLTWRRMSDALVVDHTTIMSLVKRWACDPPVVLTTITKASEVEADVARECGLEVGDAFARTPFRGSLQNAKADTGEADDLPEAPGEGVELPTNRRGNDRTGAHISDRPLPDWRTNPYRLTEEFIPFMSYGDRLEWLLDIYRLYHDDENDDTYPCDVLDALNMLARRDDPEWNKPRLGRNLRFGRWV